MNTRNLGTTGLEVPILSFGASSLGQEFRKITIEEAMSSVRVAIDNGMVTLRRAGLMNAARGVTSIEEVQRVTMAEETDD